VGYKQDSNRLFEGRLSSSVMRGNQSSYGKPIGATGGKYFSTPTAPRAGLAPTYWPRLSLGITRWCAV